MYIDYNEQPMKWLLFVILGSIVGLIASTLMLLPGGLMTAYAAWAIDHPSPWSISSSIAFFVAFWAGAHHYS